jgi:peptide deformylase
MRLKIVQTGEPVLRQAAAELTAEHIASRQTQELIDHMMETMRDAPGVGLAAPQVGLSLQLAVIEDRAEYMKDIQADTLVERERRPVPFHVIINPKLTLIEGSPLEFHEGCLSVAGFAALVPRARQVRVECLDRDGQARTIEAAGWYARILQHEIDHLNGTLYLDRMWPRSFTTVENLNRHWKEKSAAEIRGQKKGTA